MAGVLACLIDVMRPMVACNVSYDEGSWFALPLRSGGWAVGVVGRLDRKNEFMTGYFFGPRRESLPAMDDVEGIRPETAAMVCNCHCRELINGAWPILGQASKWRREDWGIPVFVRDWHKDRGLATFVYYTGDDLTKEKRWEVIEYTGSPHCEKDTFMLSGAAAALDLDMRLGGSRDKFPGTWDYGPFDNRAASEWAQGFAQEWDLAMLELAFAAAEARAEAGLDERTAAVTIVAAEVVAMLRGHPSGPYGSEIATTIVNWTWAHRYELRPAPTLVKRALAALDLATGDGSELRRLWSGVGDLYCDAWLRLAKDLRKRLRAR